MQNYTEISQNDQLLASLAMILNNDKTALSCSSGTAFPTTNVQVGQLCFRTDENKLYQTKDGATWTEIANLAKSFSQHKADLLLKKEAFDVGVSTVSGLTRLRGDDLPRFISNTSGLTGTIAIKLPSKRTATMVSVKLGGYEYVANKGRWELNIGGYTYSSGWLVTGANSPSNLPWGDTVRFAEDDTNAYILLGAVTSKWYYSKIWIEEVVLSYSGQQTVMSDPSKYEIVLLTDETPFTVQSVVTVNSGVSATAVNDGVYLTTAQTITGAKTFSANTAITSSTNSTSSTNGALVVTGGLGVGGAVNVGGNLAVSGTLTSGAATFAGVSSTTGTFTSVTDSVSTSTGAIVTSGGLGVAKSVTVGGGIDVTGSSTVGGTLSVTGKLTAGSIDSTGAVKVSSTAVSTSKTTGAIIVTGGLGVGGDIFATNINGNLIGNSSSATKLQTARLLNGASFDGTANVSVPALLTTISTNGLDLNTFQTPGFYSCPASAVASTLLNCPTAVAFSLFVEKAAGAIQVITEYPTGGAPKTFKRHFYNGTWGEWYEILTTLNSDLTKLPLTGGTITGDLKIFGPSNMSLSIGRTDGVASTPYIDFNSGATVADYDARIIASGGNGSVDGGTLNYKAASHVFSSGIIAPSADFSGGSVKVGSIQCATALSFLNGGSAQKISTGGVLASNSYADSSLVPTYGIYSKGDIATAGNVVGAAPSVSTTLAALGMGTSATFQLSEINVGTTYGYLPYLSGKSTSTSGYRQHVSIGAYRPASDWTNGGAYIAVGTSDASPTEAYLFKNGRIIANTAGAIQLEGNADTATKLQTARTINGVAFDGTSNITIADNTKVSLLGATMSGSLSAASIGINNSSSSTGLGLSLYAGSRSGMPEYGIAFAGTGTFGGFGSVTGDWATYFTMTGTSNRGWIFKLGNGAGGNVASISASGVITGSEIVSESGKFVAPTGAYHYIDIGKDGADRQIFGSYGGVYYFRNTLGNTDVVTINNGAISCIGSITAGGNITAYSDKRIKKNIKKIPDALSKIEALKGVTFERKDTKERQTGLIAQEVEAVLPEAVTRHAPSDAVKKFIKEDEILAVSYGSLAGLFVEAIKELNKKLEAQAKMIDKQSLLIENLLNQKVSHN